MEDPGKIPGWGGDTGKGRGVVSVKERISECVNLEGVTMAVKLSTYDIVEA